MPECKSSLLDNLTCVSGTWSIREVITTFWYGLLYCTCNPM